MTVDLSKLKVGDTVKFRNGVTHVVTHIRPDHTPSHPYWINNLGSYTENGVWNLSHQSAIDIMEIIPQQQPKETTMNLASFSTEALRAELCKRELPAPIVGEAYMGELSFVAYDPDVYFLDKGMQRSATTLLNTIEDVKQDIKDGPGKIWKVKVEINFIEEVN